MILGLNNRRKKMDPINKIFLVHSWETIDDKHHLHIWSPHLITISYENWSEALENAYLAAIDLNLDFFQVDHPDFPHKFIKVMGLSDVEITA
jgi:hypothetical protein